MRISSRQRRPALVLIGLVMASTTACARAPFTLPNTKSALDDGCELFFRVRSREPEPVVFSDWQCIEQDGAALKIPENIFLRHKAGWSPSITTDRSKYCDDDASNQAKEKLGVDKSENVCVWNRIFSDTLPLTFDISTSNSDSPPKDAIALNRYIGAVRVVRNGSVVFAWDASRRLEPRHTLTIRGSDIRTEDLIPTMSDLGIYILSAGEEVDVSQLPKVAQEKPRAWITRLRAGFRNMVTDPFSALGQGGLSSEFECLDKQTEYISKMISAASTGNQVAEDSAAIAALDKWFTDQGVKYSDEAKQKREPVDVATADNVNLNKPAPAEIDGAKLVDGNIVLLLGQVVRGENGFYQWTQGQKLTRAQKYDGKTDGVFFSPNQGTKNKGKLYRVKANSVSQGFDVAEATPMLECKAPAALKAEQQDKLKKLFDQFAKKAIDKVTLDKEVAEFARRIGASANQDLDAAILAARKSAEDYFSKRLREQGATSEVARQRLDTLQSLETIAAVLREQVESIPSMIAHAEQTVVKVAHDPAAQQSLYQSFAKGVGNEDNIFVPRKPNPEKLASEALLSMKYRDFFQYYYFAAWNGIPLPTWSAPKGYIKYEPRVENVIPIIDVLGFRWQADRTWIPNVRLALGFFGTRETRVVVTTTTDGQVEKESPTNFHIGPQLNLSVGVLQGGIGYLVRSDKALGTDYADLSNVRVLVGLDLLKLITGNEVSAFKSSDEPDAESGSKN